MAGRRRKRHNYKFTEKTHSLRGIFAIVLAVLSIAACIVMIWNAYQTRGNANIYIGSAGIMGFFVSVASLIVAISSVREPETYRVIPYTSLIIAILTTAMWIALYIGGL